MVHQYLKNMKLKIIKKNNNEQQTSKSSLNSPNNPFANANGPIDVDDKDLPF